MSQISSHENMLSINDQQLRYVRQENNLVKFKDGNFLKYEKKHFDWVNRELEVEAFEKLILRRVDSVEHVVVSGLMTFHGDRGTIIEFEGKITIYLLINLLNMSPCYLVAHLVELNPRLEPQSLVFDFLFQHIKTITEEEIKTVGDAVEYDNDRNFRYLETLDPKTKFDRNIGCFNYFEHKLQMIDYTTKKYPFFMDGSDHLRSMTPVMTIHPKAKENPEILADFMRNNLLAIVGVAHHPYFGPVITFVDRQCENFPICVLHIINNRPNFRIAPEERQISPYLIDGIGFFANIPIKVQLDACSIIIGSTDNKLTRFLTNI
jgi:hypothetical protein